VPVLPIERVEAAAYTIPTEEGPEADGTLTWEATTLVAVHVTAGGTRALGYTYADTATAVLVRDTLAPLLHGRDALATAERYEDMSRRVRNLGRRGIAAMAVSAVDVALWDLKARHLGVALGELLGPARAAVPGYGSGGFCNQPIGRLLRDIERWQQQGFTRAKIKVGRDAAADRARVAAARHALGEAELFVDANGAWARKAALAAAQWLAAHEVRWLEEPVSSDDLDGLRLLRDRSPPGLDIAAGEYGYVAADFRALLASGAVDVLQADATRCGGVTGFLACGALCAAFEVPLSAHCAPALHAPLCCAVPDAVHLEYFHDHARIERMLFDGAGEPRSGCLAFDRSRPGLGLELKAQDAACFRA
jgi:L-alanine-DL-glutamate epimerase-like enolase superfamily enzyme